MVIVKCSLKKLAELLDSGTRPSYTVDRPAVLLQLEQLQSKLAMALSDVDLGFSWWINRCPTSPPPSFLFASQRLKP